jgi:hypothetical protein
VVSLEDFKGGSKRERLTPRSIEAIKRQGLTQEELKFVSFKKMK